jgi:hypothetical protein
MTLKGKAVLFGLNYSHCANGKLKGCINDVFNMAKYIHALLDIPIELYTDDTDIKSTSYDGIISKLHDVAIDSYKNDLDFVWIHFSGHGSQQKDVSGDEADGLDEGLVPSDYERKGIIIDDIIHKTFCSFNPKTKILFICDSCHSGTILDLKFNWGSDKQCTIDNKNNSIKSNTMLISGCEDNQTSADAFNLLNDNKSVGALSATILKVLSKKPEKIYNAFSLINSVRNELKRGGYTQIPSLSTNYDISENSSLIPTNSQTFNTVNSNEKVKQNVQHQVSQQYVQQHVPQQVSQEYVQQHVPQQVSQQYVQQHVPQQVSQQYVQQHVPQQVSQQYVQQHVPQQVSQQYVQQKPVQKIVYMKPMQQNSQQQYVYYNQPPQYYTNTDQQYVRYSQQIQKNY